MRVHIINAHYRDADDAVRRVFAALRPDVRGKRVLIKPNSLSEREPEMAANTHPVLLGAVMRAVREAGAAEVLVGDNPGQANYGKIRRVFATNGLGDVAGEALVNLGMGLVPRRLASLTLDLYFPRLLFEVDYVISVPKLKVHPWTGMSAGVKNTFGYLPGAQKSRCHAMAATLREFEGILRDIHLLRPPDLTVLDAILMVEARTEGLASLRYLGYILASAEASAVDVLAAAILGLRADSLPHVAEVARARSVPLDVGSLDIVGKWSPVSDIRLAQGFGPGETPRTWTHSPDLLAIAYRTVLDVDDTACDGCGDCVLECPAGILEMAGDDPGYPTLSDSRRCTSCFACLESCTRNAIDLKTGPIPKETPCNQGRGTHRG